MIETERDTLSHNNMGHFQLFLNLGKVHRSQFVDASVCHMSLADATDKSFKRVVLFQL